VFLIYNQLTNIRWYLQLHCFQILITH